MYLRRSYLVHFFWPPGDRSWFWPGGHLPEGVVVGLPLPLPSSSAANDGAAVTVSATTSIAASVSIKIMRFMRYLLSLPHPPNAVPLKRCQVGCEFAGAGRVVCASTFSYKQASCPLPVHEYFVGPILGSSPPSSARFHLLKEQNRPLVGPNNP